MDRRPTFQQTVQALEELALICDRIKGETDDAYRMRMRLQEELLFTFRKHYVVLINTPRHQDVPGAKYYPYLALAKRFIMLYRDFQRHAQPEMMVAEDLQRFDQDFFDHRVAELTVLIQITQDFLKTQ